MKSLLRVRHSWFIGVMLILALIVTACKPDATSEIISPELGAKLVAAEEAMAVDAVVEEVVELPTLEELSEEEIVAGLPDEMIAALAEADASNGETLALINACVGCHITELEPEMTGPTWYNIGDTAISRIEGQSPALYLYNSIVAPNDYIVAGYPENIMPLNYNETISQEDLADLLAYLLAQHEGATE